MAKRVILTEAQMKEYMRLKMNEAREDMPSEIRELTIEEVKELLRRMVDDDFYVYFPMYDKKYVCSSLNDKGEIFEAVCSSYPKLLSDGNISAKNRSYGVFEVENIIGVQ